MKSLNPLTLTLTRIARFKLCSALFVLSALLPTRTVLALESDKAQNTQIDADQMTYSETKAQKVNTFSGNVMLTRGTLIIKGDKLIFSEESSGKQLAAMEGKPASFKQQRESKDSNLLMITGQANRIEYNAQANQIILQGNASIIKTSNDQITEQISGNQITYEQTTEFLSVDSSGKTPKDKPSRVKAVIKPINE